MEFLLNTWYVAGWASELGAATMLPRRLLDEPVVMFRDSGGRAHALHDRCPHRFSPLSRGQLIAENGTVQCGYHGLQFDGSGRCTLNPLGAGTIPSAAKVRAYPLVGLRKPFANEDTPMLEAQQASIADADFWSLRPVLLEGDAAAVRVRRLLEGLVQAERATAASGA